MVESGVDVLADRVVPCAIFPGYARWWRHELKRCPRPASSIHRSGTANAAGAQRRSRAAWSLCSLRCCSRSSPHLLPSRWIRTNCMRNRTKDREPPSLGTAGPYVAFVCGGIILLIGVYLEFIGAGAAGYTLAGRSGTGGGEPVSVPGWGYMFIGSLFFLPGAWFVIRNKRNR